MLEAYDFSGVRTIMDVGGGNGSLALAILEKHPGMKGKVVDLPVHRAAGEVGHPRRPAPPTAASFEAGNFFEAVPAGADLHVLKFILHDWNDEECVRILKSCRASLEPGGRLRRRRDARTRRDPAPTS